MHNIMLSTRGGWSARLLASLSYVGVLSLIPLFLSRDDEFVAFHAKQGLVLWMWALLAFIALLIPGFGIFFFKASLFLIPMLSIIGLIAVMLNKAWTLPLVYVFARNI